MANATGGSKQVAKLHKRKVFHIVLVTTAGNEFDQSFTGASAFEVKDASTLTPLKNGAEWQDGEIVNLSSDFLRARIAFSCTKRGKKHPALAARKKDSLMSIGDPGTGFMLITLENSSGAGATTPTNPTVDPVPVDFVDDTEQ